MEQLTQKSVIDLKVIAKMLDTSESTIRRDIDRLEKQGKLKRVLGGAELADVSGSDVAEFTMRQKYGM
ncbi:MAG: DeoR family transcriptional regulator, partial [Clostridia bacterium]